jgi:hypothetical protein
VSNALRISTALHDAQPLLTPDEFSQWAAAELGMDQATVRDFLAFEAKEQLTARMEHYFGQFARDAITETPPTLAS